MTRDTARRLAEEFTRKAWDGGHPSVTTAFLAGWDAAIEHAEDRVAAVVRDHYGEAHWDLINELGADIATAIREERSRPMTPDEKARAEALGVMREAREQVGLTVQEQARYVEGFVAGSAWQRSQPVEITEEMVEAGARAQFDFDWHGEKSWLDADRGVRVQYERGFRAALSAALGGEGR